MMNITTTWRAEWPVFVRMYFFSFFTITELQWTFPCSLVTQNLPSSSWIFDTFFRDMWSSNARIIPQGESSIYQQYFLPMPMPRLGRLPPRGRSSYFYLLFLLPKRRSHLFDQVICITVQLSQLFDCLVICAPHTSTICLE